MYLGRNSPRPRRPARITTRRRRMSETLLLEKAEGVATVTFNHPEKANALDVAWLPLMTRFFQEVEHDPAIRCVLLNPNGKHFMAGGNLDYVEAFVSKPPEERAVLAEEPIHQYNVMVGIMRRLGKPVVAS